MLALVACLAALVILGAMEYLPRWLAVDNGIVSIEPSLLTVDKGTRGIATLGSGYTVALGASGFRYAHGDYALADTVTGGAPVVAILGSVTDGAELREHVTATLPDVHVTHLDLRPGLATYTGTVSGIVDGVRRTLPLRWQVALSGDLLHTTVAVPGADALVISLLKRPNVIGVPPTLPERNLRLHSWWYAANAPAESAFTWSLPTVVGTGPDTVPRALDASVDGRIDLHVWADTATLSLTRVVRRPSID